MWPIFRLRNKTLVGQCTKNTGFEILQAQRSPYYSVFNGGPCSLVKGRQSSCSITGGDVPRWLAWAERLSTHPVVFVDQLLASFHLALTYLHSMSKQKGETYLPRASRFPSLKCLCRSPTHLNL